MKKPKKYTKKNLLLALRIFVKARTEALKVDGFTDNGGAIHSIERIVDILACGIKYPQLSHINSLKKRGDAEISVKGFEARERGEAVKIEHVMPQRAFAHEIIRRIQAGDSDDEIEKYIEMTYRLVLLSEDEAKHIDKVNRSVMTEDRVKDAGINMKVSS